MTLKSIGLVIAALFFASVEHVQAQEFEVGARLEQCVLTAAEVQGVDNSDGKTMQFSVTSCLTTARRTCQFTTDAEDCFSQYVERVEELSRGIRASLPYKVDGVDGQSNRMNRRLSEAKSSVDAFREYCLNSVESDLPVELLYLPAELRSPAKACEILVPSYDLSSLLLTKALLDSMKAKK
ncbi:hypothetical protein TRL7639_03176 [Falsiruegeria litorea R37]|uniref:Uncharacterized protein n=1 Tax=Falsiruegeria litorea R37 TaxID=1200284 RepID=A0A1Y5TDL4_9RHOB|nr:hypothetical protein [Falsiruegeria litorea]SLN57932.1 hypothetical protein TRL7639_03176 [Falsiruegeria litorea R37]